MNAPMSSVSVDVMCPIEDCPEISGLCHTAEPHTADDEDQSKSMDYGQLAATITGALQYTIEEQEQLKQELAETREMVKMLQTQIDELTKALNK